MQTKKVLICGAGIAGPTFAYWLKRSAFTPTLLERAPTLRTSGYVIDFWGLGYDIAEKMGFYRTFCAKDITFRNSGSLTSVGIELPASALRCLRTLPVADLSR